LGAISGFCQVVVPAGMTLTQISFDVFRDTLVLSWGRSRI
jgi:hypothetical protein